MMPVVPGQIWTVTDPRFRGRSLRVDRVDPTFAYCTNITDAGGFASSPRKSRVQISRLDEKSRQHNYRLLIDQVDPDQSRHELLGVIYDALGKMWPDLTLPNDPYEKAVMNGPEFLMRLVSVLVCQQGGVVAVSDQEMESAFDMDIKSVEGGLELTSSMVDGGGSDDDD